MLAFTVYGTPIPKGSTKAFVPKGWSRPVITHDNAKTKPWQDSIVTAAREALAGAAPLETPVGLAISFYLPRPKSAPRRITRPTKKPDLDKLVRCVKDALTRAGVYRDDSQVVVALVEKSFAGGGDDPLNERGVPRADVRVYTMQEREAMGVAARSLGALGDLFAAAERA